MNAPNRFRVPAAKPAGPLRARIHEIIYEADTPGGKLFDVVLILAIVTSVVVVMLESVVSIRATHGPLLRRTEWVFTILFSVEYLLRLYCIGRSVRYATSFFGAVDLLAILPTYLDVLFPGARYLLVIRMLRVLRVFRVLKLVQYVGEAGLLMRMLADSVRKITVFLFAVVVLATVLGSVMYLIEGESSGFTSIPRSMYWAIVTLTTVGYGDIAPRNPVGQALAAFIMILGYSIIVVPIGIVTADLTRTFGSRVSTQACPECSREGHAPDAKFCKYCGSAM